jgi:hypothetical protein
MVKNSITLAGDLARKAAAVDPAALSSPPPLELPKTAIVEQFAEENDIPVVNLDAATLDITDATGHVQEAPAPEGWNEVEAGDEAGEETITLPDGSTLVVDNEEKEFLEEHERLHSVFSATRESTLFEEPSPEPPVEDDDDIFDLDKYLD